MNKTNCDAMAALLREWLGTDADSQDDGFQEWTESFAERATHALSIHDSPPSERGETSCKLCDGSGDVHRADGEYVGKCPVCSNQPESLYARVADTPPNPPTVLTTTNQPASATPIIDAGMDVLIRSVEALNDLDEIQRKRIEELESELAEAEEQDRISTKQCYDTEALLIVAESERDRVCGYHEDWHNQALQNASDLRVCRDLLEEAVNRRADAEQERARVVSTHRALMQAEEQRTAESEQKIREMSEDVTKAVYTELNNLELKQKLREATIEFGENLLELSATEATSEAIQSLLTFVENGIKTNSRDISDWRSDLDSVADMLRAWLTMTPRPEEKTSDPGTEKLLRGMLDRAYKMMLMAGYRVAEQDSDSNDPIVAWMSDARHVLYGSGHVPDLVADLQSVPPMNFAPAPEGGAIQRLRETIRGFAKLDRNWDSYDAAPFNQETIDLALHVAGWLGDGWGVVPSADGPSVYFAKGAEEATIDVYAEPCMNGGTVK